MKTGTCFLALLFLGTEIFSDEHSNAVTSATHLLKGIDTLKREDRLARWRQIYGLSGREPSVRKYLDDVARGKIPAGRYQRYVAAANVAGFGKVTSIGPNSVENISLDLYIRTMAAMPVPSTTKRRLRLNEQAKSLFVTIEPNETNDLRFQEILWEIIRKYNLDFRTEADGTFLIVRVSVSLGPLPGGSPAA